MSNLPVNSLIALPERHGGAARLSVFFALWTLALLVMHDVRVNAAPIYENSPTADAGWLMTPAPAPQIDATSMWDAMSQQSDVMSGRWNGVAHAQMHSKVVVPASRTASAHTELRMREPVAAKKESTAIVKTSSDLADAERQVARRIAARDFGGAIELIREGSRRESARCFAAARTGCARRHRAGRIRARVRDAPRRLAGHSRFDQATRSARGRHGAHFALCGGGRDLPRTADVGFEQHALVGGLRGHPGETRPTQRVDRSVPHLEDAGAAGHVSRRVGRSAATTGRLRRDA